MTKPRGRKSGMNHTVSLTDGEWQRIRAWARERGKSASAWFCECALAVDLFPETAPARPLVLDAEQQQGLARSAAAAARDMRSGGEASSTLADDMRALLELRLRAMARRGRRERAVELLRRVLGDERAAVVAAAVLSDAKEVAKPPKAPKAPAGSAEGPGQTDSTEPDLFTEGGDCPAGGA